MSKRIEALAGVYCLRCAYYGVKRDPAGLPGGPPSLELLYCQDCADYLKSIKPGRASGDRAAAPPQITHYDEEAT